MSLRRKEIKAYFDHDIHDAIKHIAEAEGYGDALAAWVETVVEAIVRKRVHAASLVISGLKESGALQAFTDEPRRKQVDADNDGSA